MKQGQSSLEYLLTYSLALFILAGAMASVVSNRPDVDPPDQCEVSGPFMCVESAKSGDNVRVLLRPTGSRDLTVGNASFTYRNQEDDTNVCYFGNRATGTTSRSSLNVQSDQRFEAVCSSANHTPTGTFLPEQEEMHLDFEYREEGLTFGKTAQVQLLK